MDYTPSHDVRCFVVNRPPAGAPTLKLAGYYFADGASREVIYAKLSAGRRSRIHLAWPRSAPPIIFTWSPPAILFH